MFLRPSTAVWLHTPQPSLSSGGSSWSRFPGLWCPPHINNCLSFSFMSTQVNSPPTPVKVKNHQKEPRAVLNSSNVLGRLYILTCMFRFCLFLCDKWAMNLHSAICPPGWRNAPCKQAVVAITTLFHPQTDSELLSYGCVAHIKRSHDARWNVSIQIHISKSWHNIKMLLACSRFWISNNGLVLVSGSALVFK